jgi:hypothetical protein
VHWTRSPELKAEAVDTTTRVINSVSFKEALGIMFVEAEVAMRVLLGEWGAGEWPMTAVSYSLGNEIRQRFAFSSPQFEMSDPRSASQLQLGQEAGFAADEGGTVHLGTDCRRKAPRVYREDSVFFRELCETDVVLA